MDSSPENSKQLRSEHGQILEQQCDWLSNLPTDILHHILSYLDNTEVVKTRFLSRRWRYVWVSVPCLNFDFRCFWNERFQFYSSYHACLSKFWELVEDNLIIRDLSPTYKLRFFCDGYGEEQFKLLLSFCVMRNVEELILLAGYELQHCPCCTDPGSPIKQKINGLVNLQQYLRAFDNLKTLHLVKVQFPHPDITENLFSNCGVLENLLMESCCFGKIDVLNISAQKLKTFHFVNEDHYRCGNRCEFEGELKVDTPSLVSFFYIGPRILPCVFSSDMPFLNHAVIQFWLGVYEPKLNPKMGTMVSRIHGVKELSLSRVFVLYFSLSRGKPCGEFNYLRFLKLDVGHHEDYMEGLINVLKITPNLEALCLLLTPCFYRGQNRTGLWKSREEDLPCFSTHLKTVEISDFHDASYPLELVKFFLQNGKCLENMKIVQKKQISTNPMILHELHSIPLASEAVSVDVFTVSDTGRTQLCQFVYEKCRASTQNRTKFLRIKPIRRSKRIAALKCRGSS